MAFNPMQQQQSPDMLMAMMTDPRSTPQQRMAAMNALNALRGGANAPQQPPQMTGDSTGVSQMNPAFMAAVRQEMLGQGPEEQPEIPQRQAAPEAPENPATAALMSGAADASRVAAMAHGGAVRHYRDGTDGNDPSSYQTDLPPDPVELLRIATTAIDPITQFRAKAALSKMRGQVAPPAGALSEKLKALVPPEMTQEEAIEKFYTEGGGRNNPQLIKDVFSNISDISPERLVGKLGSAISRSAGYLYEKAEPYARRAIDYSVGSELTQDPDFVAEETRKKRMGDSVPGEERYQLESLRDFKPTIQEFPINADAAEAAVPAAVAAPRANAAAAAAKALTTPPPAAVKPGKPDPAAEAMNERKQAESDAYKERMNKLLSDDQPLSSQDKWMALARAGFAAAAGSSPNALQNIGAGLGKGLESLDELRKERAINRMKQATLLQSQRSEELTSEDRKTTAGIQQQLANLKKREVDMEGDPNSPKNKYYGRVGRPEETLFEQKRAAQQEVDAMQPGPKQDAAQKSLDRITGAVPEGMSVDAINKRIQEEAMAAYKDFERDWAGDIKNGSKTAEQKKVERDTYVRDRINQARNIFSPQGSAAPPPAAGGGWSATEVK